MYSSAARSRRRSSVGRRRKPDSRRRSTLFLPAACAGSPAGNSAMRRISPPWLRRGLKIGGSAPAGWRASTAEYFAEARKPCKNCQHCAMHDRATAAGLRFCPFLPWRSGLFGLHPPGAAPVAGTQTHGSAWPRRWALPGATGGCAGHGFGTRRTIGFRVPGRSPAHSSLWLPVVRPWRYPLSRLGLQSPAGSDRQPEPQGG